MASPEINEADPTERDSAEDRLRKRPAGAEAATAAAAEPGPPISAGDVFRWAVAGGLGLLSVALVAFAVYSVRNLLVLVVISLFIAVSLDPAVRWLIRRGVRRSLAVAIIFLITILILGVFVLSVTPPLVRQATQLFGDLPGYIERLQEQSAAYRRLAERFNLTERLAAYVSALPERLVGNAVSFTRRFLGAVVSMLTVLVLTIYFMADLPRLRRGLVRLFPRPRRPRVAEVVNVLVDKVGAYMIGNLIISVIAGVTAFVVLTVLGLPFALPLALVIAITDLIPLIGATLGAIFGTAVTFFTSGLWPEAVLVAVFFLVYQQVENYLIVPRIMRNTVNISSLAVLLAALLGGTVLGVIGALMAIPVAAAVKVLITPVLDGINEPAPGARPADPS